MQVSMIVAMDQNNGIGYKGRLMWRLSSDMKRFKNLTWGHHVIMGRKTYEAIGRALPGRVNLVISRNQTYHAPGCVMAPTLTRSLEYSQAAGETEAFVIGGAEIFAQALPFTQRIYLTQVQASLPADVYFPSIDPGEWETLSQQEFERGERDQFPYTYSVMERIPEAGTELGR
jgi:dihydrofolate reductase